MQSALCALLSGTGSMDPRTVLLELHLQGEPWNLWSPGCSLVLLPLPALLPAQATSLNPLQQRPGPAVLGLRAS